VASIASSSSKLRADFISARAEDIADLLAYYRDRAMPTRRPPEATSDDESVTRHELVAKSHLKLR